MQIQEVLELHQGLTGEAAKNKTLEILHQVGIDIPPMRYRLYPHEFSGGMRQRVVIAIAVACNPRILICDEPTTALDVTIQAQILELIRNLQKALKLTIIYITHDLGVVANVADYVAVMYAGDIIEYGTAEEIFYDARHPYTWALLSSLPSWASRVSRSTLSQAPRPISSPRSRATRLRPEPEGPESGFRVPSSLLPGLAHP
jgi:oligopeptide transport system ATP-binding protein